MPTAMSVALRYAAEIGLVVTGLLMLMFLASAIWPDPELNVTPIYQPTSPPPVGGR